MNQGDDQGAEKSHEPTQKRLDDARKKGDIAKSTDITVAASYVGLLVALMTLGGSAVLGAAEILTSFIDRPEQYRGLILGSGGLILSGQAMLLVAGSLAPLFLAPAALALVSLIAQRAIILAPSKLAPKLSRISPIENAKNKYGLSGLFEFAKSTLKLFAIATALVIVFWQERDRLISTARAEPAAIGAVMGALTVQFLTVTTLIVSAIAVLDWLFQLSEHRRKLRMTHKELRDESKEVEGDPLLKAQRRRKAEDIARNRMLAEVPRADVVVVNPTHYAVALTWERRRGTAPVCIAKGTDLVAQRIREIAEEAKVPIHSDPPTARALHATVDLGAEILPEHYKAVAAAIQFADKMRRAAREAGLDRPGGRDG